MTESLIDNDLYKLSMQQAVHALYPRAEAAYSFINRGDTEFPEGFAEEFKRELEKFASLELSSDEYEFVKSRCYFLTPVYLDFLRNYRFDVKEVSVSQRGSDFNLEIRGPWFRTILWEVPLMALVCELYYRMTGAEPVSREERKINNISKAKKLSEAGVYYADFGTRRRFSRTNHEEVIRDLASFDNSTLIGTSNIRLAMKTGLKPIGTMAHEWFMFHAVKDGYAAANSSGIRAWADVYKGDLGIALSDTYTTEVFLAEFNTFFAKLFDGVRQDSGDPYAFVDRIIAHYRKLHINPHFKTVVFSDGLDVDKAVKIHRYCSKKILDSFGIGTNLTNDVGVKPLNIVIKMKECRVDPSRKWRSVVKLSDINGKNTGNDAELEHCRSVLNRSFK